MPNPVLSPVPGLRADGSVRIETGTSRTRAYVGARRAVTLSYRVTGTLASPPTVELVSASDGATVRTWAPGAAASGTIQSVSWDGRLGRAAARPGRYSFRLTAATAAGAEVHTAQTGDVERDAFDLYDDMFPVRGRHDFGGAGAGFGPAGQGTPTRATTSSPAAEPRWPRRAAGACSSSSTTRPRATTW